MDHVPILGSLSYRGCGNCKSHSLAVTGCGPQRAQIQMLNPTAATLTKFNLIIPDCTV